MGADNLITQDQFITVLEPKVGQRECEDKEQALEMNKTILVPLLDQRQHKKVSI